MPVILQINVTANSGSTGRIAEQINQLAQNNGWETYIAYGRSNQPCKSKLIHTSNKFQVYEHYAEHRLFDNDGLASRVATRQLVNQIREIKPDIIHLHNIHDHWLNYQILFEYLNTLDIPVVWTQHDCWSFTGGCPYFSMRNCYRWRDGGCTQGCPMKKHRIIEKTKRHYQLKHDLFTATKKLTLVPVSRWLEEIVRQSFFKCHNIVTIQNGVDVSAFYPTYSIEVRQKYGIGTGWYVIGIASQWSVRKGFDDYLQLSSIISKEVKIVMVGLNADQAKKARLHGIVSIPRTQNVGELAALYSGAMMTLNLSREETFGLTTVEGYACGTPGVVYNATASPELVLDSPKTLEQINTGEPLYVGETGWIVGQGDVEAVAKVISDWMGAIAKDPDLEVKMRKECRERAEREFNKDNKFADYLNLYNELLAKK